MLVLVLSRRVAVLLALTWAASAHASDLGSDGQVHFADDAIFRVDFEDATKLAPSVQLLTYDDMNSVIVYTPLAATDLATHLQAAGGAIEGKQALHWLASDGGGLQITDAATFAAVAGGRFQVSFWGRAEGIEPYVGVTWSNAADVGQYASVWAHVPAIRTGRETSDGWIEYSTGPLDGTVVDRPVSEIVVSAWVINEADRTLLFYQATPRATDAMTLDAIEVRPVAGTPSTGTCTALTVDTACGANGECQFGRCVDSAVIWHPVPSLAMQQEIVARVNLWMTHIMGDRHAVAALPAGWSATTLGLASANATPRSFWGGINQQVVAMRDTHTTMGDPYVVYSTRFDVRPTIDSGALDVCFGPTVNDLGDGKLAYVVWLKGTGAPDSLAVGDVLMQIDGIEPRAWVDQVYPRYVSSLPNDPSADWAPSAGDLATLIANHASTIVVARCTTGTCIAQPPIDVAAISMSSAQSAFNSLGTLSCDARFSTLVPGDRTDASGGDLLVSAALDAQTVGIEFDGFSPTDSNVWTASLDAAFVPPHAHMIVDARVGYGGDLDLGNYMVNQFRGTSAPLTLALTTRGSFSDPDAAGLFAFDWNDCVDISDGITWECADADVAIMTTSNATPVGEASKVAWLNTDDVSDNDLVTRMLKGRANLRVFAPVPTYGAFGSVIVTPPLMTNWTSGTMAISDARSGTSVTTAEMNQVCESGQGVAPDQVVAQTESDVLKGVDTMVVAAKAWLAE